MAAHSSVLAWRIPRTGEPSRLPSVGSHRVRHDCSDLAAAAAASSLYWCLTACWVGHIKHPAIHVTDLLKASSWKGHLSGKMEV